MPAAIFNTKTDDPRICATLGNGLVIHREHGATNVAMAMFRLPLDEEAYALVLLTPAEARHFAIELCQRADEADRRMNEALQQKEGK